MVEEVDEHAYHAKSVQLHLQGHWTQWCSFVKNDFSWKLLLSMPSALVSFSLGAVFNTLPTPNNLQRWNIVTEASCFLCGKSVCTLPHILGACKRALSQGRFTFRHDAVLKDFVLSLRNFLSSYVPLSGSNYNTIKFVKEGQKPNKTNKKTKTEGVLHTASDWKLKVDLEDGLVIPVSLAITSLRPDILLFSPLSKKAIIIELTCPCEENMGVWHEEKSQKYHPLCTSIRSNSWSVYFFAVEVAVGARGFCAESVRSCLRRLGFSNKLCNKTLKTLSSTSLKCSFEIWLSRNSKSWSLEHPHSSLQRETTIKNSEVHATSSHITKSNKTPLSPIKKSSTKNSELTSHSISAETPIKQSASSPLSSSTITKKNERCGFINKGNTCYANVILTTN